MIRRTVLAAVALAVVGGVAAPALADSRGSAPASGHSLCVLGGNNSSTTQEGICVYIPTH